jgi:hypothetical protein
MAKLKDNSRVYGKLKIDGNLELGAGVSTANGAPLKFVSGTNLSTAEAGAFEYDGTTFYATPNTSIGRTAVPTTCFTSGIGTSGITLNTNYALFASAQDTITLPVGTYLVTTRFRVAISGSTVSSACQFNIRGDGTAVGSFSWRGTGAILDDGAANAYVVAATTLGTAFSVTAASAANPRQYIAFGQGILKITTAGTIIPSYLFPATLTSGTTTLVADNYLVLQSLDTSGTSVKTGAWS